MTLVDLPFCASTFPSIKSGSLTSGPAFQQCIYEDIYIAFETFEHAKTLKWSLIFCTVFQARGTQLFDKAATRFFMEETKARSAV